MNQLMHQKKFRPFFRAAQNCIKRRRHILRPLFAALALVLSVDSLESAAPPAGTSIGNQASATYTDSSNTPRTATSNVAITIVQQVASFTLTASGAKFAAPGGQVTYPHTLVNTGNGNDTFNLSVVNAVGDDFDLNSIALYADANGDGLPDNATAITSSGVLLAGTTFKFVAVGIVPGAATAGQVGNLTVTASGTATASPAAAQNNTDATTVTTSNAVINVTKSLSANRGAPGTGPLTVTITYQNVGNNSATNLSLRDVLPSGMTYSNNSGRWSITGATTLTDADNTDAQGTSPDTIIYDYGITVAGRVTAVARRGMSRPAAHAVRRPARAGPPHSPGTRRSPAVPCWTEAPSTIPFQLAITN